jgi:uncharacterized protein (TIGR03067 family)
MHRQSSACSFLGIIVAVALFLAADLCGQVVPENNKLKGTWVLEAVRYGSIDSKNVKDEQLPKDWKSFRLTFAVDRVLIQSAAEPKGKTEPYKLDPAKNPKEMDIGRENPKEFIYKLDGDQLILAFAWGELVAGGTFAERHRRAGRPRDFKETKETAPPIIWILKHVKP